MRSSVSVWCVAAAMLSNALALLRMSRVGSSLALDRSEERVDQPVHVPRVGALPGGATDGLGEFAHLVRDGLMVHDQALDEQRLLGVELPRLPRIVS